MVVVHTAICRWAGHPLPARGHCASPGPHQGACTVLRKCLLSGVVGAGVTDGRQEKRGEERECLKRESGNEKKREIKKWLREGKAAERGKKGGKKQREKSGLTNQKSLFSAFTTPRKPPLGRCCREAFSQGAGLTCGAGRKLSHRPGRQRKARGREGFPPNLLSLPLQPQLGGGGWQAACVLFTNIRFYVEQRLRKLACKASGIPTPAAAKQTTAGLARRRGPTTGNLSHPGLSLSQASNPLSAVLPLHGGNKICRLHHEATVRENLLRSAEPQKERCFSHRTNTHPKMTSLPTRYLENSEEPTLIYRDDEERRWLRHRGGGV